MGSLVDLSKVSQITNNIFLSGIYPLDNNDVIKKNNIKYILACVDRKNIIEIHDKLMIDNPDVSEIEIIKKNMNVINLIGEAVIVGIYSFFLFYIYLFFFFFIFFVFESNIRK